MREQWGVLDSSAEVSFAVCLSSRDFGVFLIAQDV